MSRIGALLVLGQHLRVGKAITPPDGLHATVSSPASQLPTAAALAAATITAQLQAKETETSPPLMVVKIDELIVKKP